MGLGVGVAEKVMAFESGLQLNEFTVKSLPSVRRSAFLVPAS